MYRYFLLLAALAGLTYAQAPAAAGPTVVDQVVELLANKLPENLILKFAAGQAQNLKLSTADLVKLQKAGASPKLMELLMDPAAAAPAAPPAAVAPPEAVTPAAPPAAAAPESATDQPKKGNGFFRRLGDKAKGTVTRTGQNTVARAEDTAGGAMEKAEKSTNTAVDNASVKTDAAVQTKLDSTQKSVDTKMDRTLNGGTPTGTTQRPAQNQTTTKKKQ